MEPDDDSGDVPTTDPPPPLRRSARLQRRQQGEPPRKRTRFVPAGFWLMPPEVQLPILMRALIPRYEPVEMPDEAKWGYSEARMRNAITQVRLVHQRYNTFVLDQRLRPFVRDPLFRAGLYRLWLRLPTPALWDRGYDPRTALSFGTVHHTLQIPDASEFIDPEQPGQLRDGWFRTFVADTYANDHLRWVMMSGWRAGILPTLGPQDRFTLDIEGEQTDLGPLGAIKSEWSGDRGYVGSRVAAESATDSPDPDADRVFAPGNRMLLSNLSVMNLEINDLATSTRPEGSSPAQLLRGATAMRFGESYSLFPTFVKFLDRQRKAAKSGKPVRFKTTEKRLRALVALVTRNFVVALGAGSVIRWPNLWWVHGIYTPRYIDRGVSGDAFIDVRQDSRRRHFMFDASTPVFTLENQRKLESALDRPIRDLRDVLPALGLPPGAFVNHSIGGINVFTNNALHLTRARLMASSNFNVMMQRLLDNIVWEGPDIGPDEAFVIGSLDVRLQYVTFPVRDRSDPPRVEVSARRVALVKSHGPGMEPVVTVWGRPPPLDTTRWDHSQEIMLVYTKEMASGKRPVPEAQQLILLERVDDETGLRRRLPGNNL